MNDWMKKNYNGVLLITCLEYFEETDYKIDIIQFQLKVSEFFGKDSVALAHNFEEARKYLLASKKSQAPFAKIIAVYHPAFWLSISDIFGETQAHTTLAVSGRQVLPDWDIENTEIINIGKVVDDVTFQTLRNIYGASSQSNPPSTGTYHLGGKVSGHEFKLLNLTKLN